MRTVILLNILCAASGFTVPTRNAPKSSSRLNRQTTAAASSSSSRQIIILASDFASDFGSAMPEQVSPYERIGIKEEQLALGVNPEEVLMYAGTREDIIDRVMEDVPSFDRAKAESEVDKFLLDAECLRYYLEFQKRKAEDPDFALPNQEQEEGLLSFRNLVIVYLGYVAVTTVPVVFRQWVEAKEAAGEWNGSGIPFIDEWLQNSPAVDVAAVSNKASVILASLLDGTSGGILG